MPTVALPVDAERLASSWLRGRAAVTALVAQRVFTELPPPAQRVWPLVRLERIGGSPPDDELWCDVATIRFNCWGGSKAIAWSVANTIRAELTQLPGVHALGRVMRVAPGPCRYLPDDAMEPARPRVTFDIDLFTTPTS